jgi:HD-like signal output (HDOD) protein
VVRRAENCVKYCKVPYGFGRFPRSKMSVPDLRDIALRAADRMPFLPTAFQRTLGLFAAEGDEVSVGKLARVIEQDVVMTGNLLAIANSALYGRSRSVCSLRQAIARIGIRKTGNALLSFSVLRSCRSVSFPKSWSTARFNDHSLAAAIFSDLLVQKLRTQNPEWAFLVGLLHDIGLLLIATGLPDEAQVISEACSDYQVECERELLGFSHFEIGANLLSRWRCPAIVQEASLFCQSNTFEYQSPLSLGMVVKTASLLADANGFSIFGPRRNEDLAFAPDLQDAVSVQKPMVLIDVFQAEYAGFSELRM